MRAYTGGDKAIRDTIFEGIKTCLNDMDYHPDSERAERMHPTGSGIELAHTALSSITGTTTHPVPLGERIPARPVPRDLRKFGLVPLDTARVQSSAARRFLEK